MLEVETPEEMDPHVGRALGPGDWLMVTQAMIDGFAAATGDAQWIHVDVARAARDLPGGRTIAHGYLTLALVPVLSRSVWRIRARSRTVNYGCNTVRFTQPVPAGARLRVRQVLRQCQPIAGGRRLMFEATVEIEGEARPALVAETISLVFA